MGELCYRWVGTIAGECSISTLIYPISLRIQTSEWLSPYDAEIVPSHVYTTEEW